MRTYSQTNRLMQLSVDPGGIPFEHSAQLVKVEGTEGMDQLLELELEFFYPRALTIQRLRLQPWCVALHPSGSVGPQRYIHGLVTALSKQRRQFTGDTFYKATLRSRLWPMSQNKAQRIFVDQNVVDIAQLLLQEHKLPSADISGLTKLYPKRAYCVQYQESDWDFMTRILAEEGIFLYELHNQAGVKTFFGDDSTRLKQYPHMIGQQENNQVGHIKTWHSGLSMYCQKTTLIDVNPHLPESTLRVTSEACSIPRLKRFNLEQEIYPDNFQDLDHGQWLADIAQERAKCDATLLEATTTVPDLQPGLIFESAKHGATAVTESKYTSILK